jgi:hypothetical protein
MLHRSQNLKLLGGPARRLREVGLDSFDDSGRLNKQFSIAVIGLFLLSNWACALDSSVFGYQLDKPLNLPECAHRADVPQVYDPDRLVTCWEDLSATGVHTLRFSWDDTPPWVNHPDFIPLIESEGKLMGIRFATYGVEDQDAVLAELKLKYGKPSSLRTSIAQNRFGATFKVLHASWKFPTLLVLFDGGVEGDLDTGSVTIDTPLAARLRSTAESQNNTRKSL